MKTIHSRTYTNVALTVLILLLLVLAARPYVSLPVAQARSAELTFSSDTAANSRTAQLQDPYANVVAGLREIAASNRDVATAIRETARSQADVARAIQSLTSGSPLPAGAPASAQP